MTMSTQEQVHRKPELSKEARDHFMGLLNHANEIRSERAVLKRDLKAGRKQVHNFILEPPDYLQTMKLFDLLFACPKYGRVKVSKILQECKISPSKTLGGLSTRQRAEVVSMLRR